MTENQTFADFGVKPEIVSSLSAKGITAPFPIQAMTLPVALKGRDIIGQAKTGTGKTLGFGIPALQAIVEASNPGYNFEGKPQALIVVPTRELAIQVTDDLQAASQAMNVRITTLYGGRALEPQIEALKRGQDLVVGTPGRIIDLLKQRILDLNFVKIAVLDEADEMLDLGFLEDVERILKAIPAQRQTMLFSATMPAAIMALARRFMNQPTHIRAADPGDTARTKADIKQFVYRAHQLDKIEVLARILQAHERGLTVVFTRTKRDADRTAQDLINRGFAAAALHGDLNQGAREQALRAFRAGKIDVLIATDVAARGIDVEDVTHVINYTAPEDDKTFLHRTGRTGRAGKLGTAITFVDWEDLARWSLIARQLGLESTEAVETYSTSEHLYKDLNIPADAKGKLPKESRTRAGLEAETLEDLGGAKKSRQRSRTRGSRGGTGATNSNSRFKKVSGEQSGEQKSTDSPRRHRTKSGDAPQTRKRQRTRRINGKIIESEE